MEASLQEKKPTSVDRVVHEMMWGQTLRTLIKRAVALVEEVLKQQPDAKIHVIVYWNGNELIGSGGIQPELKYPFRDGDGDWDQLMDDTMRHLRWYADKCKTLLLDRKTRHRQRWRSTKQQNTSNIEIGVGTVLLVAALGSRTGPGEEQKAKSSVPTIAMDYTFMSRHGEEEDRVKPIMVVKNEKTQAVASTFLDAKGATPYAVKFVSNF